MIPTAQLIEITNKLTQLNTQAKQITDQITQNILLDLTYWKVQFVQQISGILNDNVPKLPLLEDKVNQQGELINQEIIRLKQDIQNKFSQPQDTKQPSEKTNIIQILEESFNILNCQSIIIQEATNKSDQKCIDIMSQGYFYPKMIKYLADKLDRKIIIYNAKKKKYFKYGPQSQSQNARIFLFQKNSQIFNVMRKKKEQANQVVNPTTIFSKQTINQHSSPVLNQNDLMNSIQKSIKKQIESSIKETVNQSIKKIQLQTPSKSNSMTKNCMFKDEDILEQEEEVVLTCGGNTKSCLNVFTDFDDYSLHIRKIHKGKDPKGSSHTSNGQRIQ